MSESSRKFRRAVALEYNPKEHEAPLVGALGDELIAEEMIRIARRFGIPVVEQSSLADALAKSEPDENIPPELYEPVAVVLHTLDQKAKGKLKK